MKKIVMVILAALSLTIGAKAQENPKAVWGKGRYMELGYAWAETAADGEYANPGKFGFFIRKGATYLFPRTEGWFGNILKVGFDINWIDVNVASIRTQPIGTAFSRTTGTISCPITVMMTRTTAMEQSSASILPSSANGA